MIDGNLVLTALTVGGSIVAAFAGMRAGVKNLTDRVSGLETEIKKMSDVLISVARQEERLTAMDGRMLAQGKRFDELSSRFNQWLDERFQQAARDHA